VAAAAITPLPGRTDAAGAMAARAAMAPTRRCAG
jgi:hypothetical protein